MNISEDQLYEGMIKMVKTSFKYVNISEKQDLTYFGGSMAFCIAPTQAKGWEILGVIMDSELSFKCHMDTNSIFFSLRNLTKVKQLSREAGSCFYLWTISNDILTDKPKKFIDRLQVIRNTAASISMGTMKRDKQFQFCLLAGSLCLLALNWRPSSSFVDTQQ